jgi:hypothetical protein
MRSLIQLFNQFLKPAARRFERALEQAEQTQASVQKELCDRISKTEYGKSLGFDGDWQKIPVVNYDDLEPWILQQRLTPEPVLFYERTSGSSGPAKLIPYTRSLRQSFSQMFCVWAHDLIANGPKFSTGKLYACISPQLSEETELQDDAEYLDNWLKWVLRPFLVMPEGLERLRDPKAFQHQLSLALLKAERLETISVWSPSFLQVQLKYIQTHQEVLQAELKGKISRDRSQLLSEHTIPWTELWTHLKLISCWDSMTAADQASGLRSRFPGVLVQGKGLLATEAPITIPLIEAQGYVPMLNEVFFEFEDETGIHLLHELKTGQIYTLILSQKGGLYRYRISDRVRVTHWYRTVPCLEFVGRGEAVSDLVGEKLSGSFVRNALEQLDLQCDFKSLVPVPEPPHYVLLLDRSKLDADSISIQLDQRLCQAYHYRQARLLGQLSAPQVIISAQIPEQLALHRITKGQVWGNIKHTTLCTTSAEILELRVLPPRNPLPHLNHES